MTEQNNNSVSAKETAVSGESQGTVATFAVNGMTCGHCVSAVTEEVQKLDGVRDVQVELNAGGESMVFVTAEADLLDGDVATAVDEAGYELVGRRP